MFRIVFAASLLAAMPAFAQVAPAGYREVPVPAGKTPVKMYAPLHRDPCAVAQSHRQTGKLPAAPIAQAAPDHCNGIVVAAANVSERKD